MEKAPKTLQEAIIYFADEDNCIEYLAALRWPDGVACPRCGSSKVGFLKNQGRWQCSKRHPRRQFSVKVGTLFEDSPIGLDTWLGALWMLANFKNGVSSHELSRSLGVTQKSAWFMLHRLRLALQENPEVKLSGEVEADESFIGGKARNMHADKRKARITGRGSDGKAIVMGLLERKTGKVRTNVIESRRKYHLHAEIRQHVAPGSQLYTDDLLSYDGLESDYGTRSSTTPKSLSVEPSTLTAWRTSEVSWKRGLGGTYVSVGPFHLFRYLDEQAFRYNNRKDMSDSEQFQLAASQAVGKRLTYAEVTGKVGETAAH